MHIITYVTAISMKPKRFICGIYYNTQTLSNIEVSGEFVLQLLSDQQYKLVDLLGRKSGKTTDKIYTLNKKNELATWKDFYVLKNCLSVMHLKVLKGFDAGDHKCFLCELVSYKNINDGNPLCLDDLRKRKLIRM
jgi:flavin reductase (DIM6/NTAB) family NADH-FMN oxidoreductase RutF